MNLGASGVPSTTTGGSTPFHIADPPSLTKVHKNYADLQDLLSNLPSKLNRVSNQVDKEFLSSYRVHMLSIQTELKNLKHDVTKGEQLLNSDATVAKLEAEAKWFADECGRLRQHHDAMFKDCDQIKQRLKAMREQKVFLSEQLKALMKRNKILQAEIDAANANEAASRMSNHHTNGKLKTPDNSSHGKITLASPLLNERARRNLPSHQTRLKSEDESHNWHQHEEKEEDYEYENEFADNGEEVSDLGGFSHSFNDEDKQPHHVVLSASMPNLSFSGGDNLLARDTRTASPKFLKRKVLSEDRLLQTTTLPPHHLRHSSSAKKLMSSNSQPFGHKKSVGEELEDLRSKRKELELHLEYSLREIFSEISQRKQSATHLSSTRLPSMTSAKQRREFSQSPSPDAHSPQPVSPSANGTTTRAKSGNSGVDHHLRIEPHIKSSGGITGLGLEQFSDNDRFAAVVKYLANPTVFHQVVGGLLDRFEL